MIKTEKQPWATQKSLMHLPQITSMKWRGQEPVGVIEE